MMEGMSSGQQPHAATEVTDSTTPQEIFAEVSKSQTETENQENETSPKMLELEEVLGDLLSVQNPRMEKVSHGPDPNPPSSNQQDWMTFDRSRKEKMDPGRSSGQETQEEGSCEDLWSLKNLWLERETQELGPSAYTEHEIGGEVVRVRRENIDPGGQKKRAEHSNESLPSSKKYWTPTVTWSRRKREEMATKGHAQWNFG
jgi:hypothetical protein